MEETIKKLEIERKRMNEESKKYPEGDQRKMYYIGCSLGISKALTEIGKGAIEK